MSILGIHHVTAIAGDPQANLDFYAGVLGLRLVKITVNFDDPGTYHFYYGDALGRPGSVLTFFPWPGANALRGRPGTRQVTATAFSVPEGSFGYWRERLEAHGVAVEEPVARFEEEALAFADPDGMMLELVARAGVDGRAPWGDGPVPEGAAIRGFDSAAISEEGYELTDRLLIGTMGFRQIGEEGNRFRYAVGDGGPGAVLDVLCQPDGRAGRMGIGAVHHIAWRTPGDDEEREWHARLAELGYNVSPVMDRQYFHSIYFREPGGVLFEIATDTPGFATDEEPERLGTALKLPPWLERVRPTIEPRLPRLRLPGGAARFPG